MSVRSFNVDPPFRADLAGRDGRAASTWHTWFSFVAGRLGKVAIAEVDADPGSLATSARQSATVGFPGAAVGDFAVASFDGLTADITITAAVTAANTVTVWFQNLGAGTVDLPAGTLRVRLEKR